MRVVVNDIDANLAFVEVVLSIDKLTRQYTLKEVDNSPSFSVGDSVLIYDSNDLLLVEGNIEYIGIENERKFVYAGRNNAKLIVDNYAQETTQFSKAQDIQSVLSILARPTGINVTGSSPMPKDAIRTVLVGDNLGDTFIEIAKANGSILTSDAIGNIQIESDDGLGGEKLVYGENIRNRTYRYNSTLEYDKYKIVSQSNFLTSQNQLSNVCGEYGDGIFTKVIRSRENLTGKECEDLAEKMFKIDRRKALFYKVEVDRELDLNINQKYPVLDEVAGINDTLRVKELKITIDANTDKVVATLERVLD